MAVRRGFARALAGLVAALAIAVPVVAAHPARATDPAPAPPPLRVMVLGDSISQGFAGDSTWRYWFWREARRQGVPIDMVGPDRLPYRGTAARYESAGLYFDRDHASLAGSTVGYHRGRIDGLMRTYVPQVVVVELGINDARAGDSGPRIAESVRRLLGQVWRRDPTARVVLAELPVYPLDARVDAAAVEANTLLAEQYATDPRVLLVHNRSDQRPRWNPAAVTYDGLHPNATGQTLLAQRFAEAFWRGGLLPEQPSVYEEREWRPGVAPRVRRAGRRLTIDWSAALPQVKLGSVQVVISRHATTRVLAGRSWFTAGAKRAVRTVPRGTWDVRLVPVRGTMVGTPVRAVTVRVP